MDELMTIARRIATLHDEVARGLCPHGAGRMRCGACGNEMEITVRDVAWFLRSGWPRCCGRQMYWCAGCGELEVVG